MKLPKLSSNILTAFGLNIEKSIINQIQEVELDLVKDDENKEEFYKLVCDIQYTYIT